MTRDFETHVRAPLTRALLPGMKVWGCTRRRVGGLEGKTARAHPHPHPACQEKSTTCKWSHAGGREKSSRWPCRARYVNEEIVEHQDTKDRVPSCPPPVTPPPSPSDSTHSLSLTSL